LREVMLNMSDTELAMHYVCTHERAAELIGERSRFWVSNCGCRESRGQCARSRMDVCLIFDPDDPGSGPAKHEIGRAEAEAILDEARSKQLVTRPWRDEARTATTGICFCCDDCCGYFLDPTERCDKGELAAVTDLSLCTDCGVCVEVCYFGARTMAGGGLTLDAAQCYGCGLCVAICPEECIDMR
jgi:Pyruvate/2-oxoacid:ferredoxin oxidoreductase delta subunit